MSTTTVAPRQEREYSVGATLRWIAFIAALGIGANDLHAQNALLGEATLESYYQRARSRGGDGVDPPGEGPGPQVLQRLNELETEAARLRREDRAGEALRVIARAWALSQDQEFSPRLEYFGSLVLRTDTVVVDALRPVIGWLTQHYPSTPPPGKPLRVQARLAAYRPRGIREAEPGETVGEVLSLGEIPHDILAQPMSIGLDVSAAPDGIYLLTAELLENGEPVHRLTRFVHVVHGLDSARTDVVSRLDTVQGHKDTRTSISYPFEAARYQNLGWEEPRRYDFPALIEASRQLLDRVEAGKEPLYRATGYHDRHYFFEDAGMIMPYAVYVPTTYDAARSYGLVVLLHGGYGSGSYMLPRYTPEPAESRGYIMVAPMGHSPTGGYGIRRGSTPQEERLSRLSEQDVLNVIDLVSQEYNVDDDRVYLLGQSMGCAGSWHLAQKYPDHWAGISVAGCRPPDREGLSRLNHLPILAITGELDNPQALLPLMRELGAHMKELKAKHHHYLEVKGAGHASEQTLLPNLGKIFDFFDENR